MGQFVRSHPLWLVFVNACVQSTTSVSQSGLSKILITSFATNSPVAFPRGINIYAGQQQTFKTRLAYVKADVCVQQSEKPSTAVVPEDVPEEVRRPQCSEPVPVDETNTPKVKIYYSRFQPRQMNRQRYFSLFFIISSFIFYHESLEKHKHLQVLCTGHNIYCYR